MVLEKKIAGNFFSAVFTLLFTLVTFFQSSLLISFLLYTLFMQHWFNIWLTVIQYVLLYHYIYPIFTYFQNNITELSSSCSFFHGFSCFVRLVLTLGNSIVDRLIFLIAESNWSSCICEANNILQAAVNFTYHFRSCERECDPEKNITIRPNDKPYEIILWKTIRIRHRLRDASKYNHRLYWTLLKDVFNNRIANDIPPHTDSNGKNSTAF